ncbi:hypothetical protein GCM10027079_21880 [Sediminivirga luteola]|uniref:Bacteriocin biosynthesis cyclodehydratase domain-containing protein n=1 Tax=Sediminivirga luteola TaxID=1774748 RepID=A0A8J2TW94_9MICO|nr:hypothetical protein GCM10011333_07720 [Sediminivirga luteola]
MFGAGTLAILEGLSPAAGEFLLRLREGVPGSGLEEAAARAALPVPEAEAMLAALSEAGLLIPAGEDRLWHPEAPGAQTWAWRHGLDPDAAAAGWEALPLQLHGPHAGHLAVCLREAGFRPVLPHGIEDGPSDGVTVVTSDFVADAGQLARLTLDDRVHLPVVFTDAGAQVGPLVVPGAVPCTGCGWRHRREADPGWPQTYRQLLNTALPAVDAAVSHLTAALVIAALRRYDADGAASQALLVELPECRPEPFPFDFHPGCDCRGPAPLRQDAGADSVPPPDRSRLAT